MEDIFIKSIHINKVRHLENIDIPISETERKHLILTGKNGSGKTSTLLELKKGFHFFFKNYSELISIANNKRAIPIQGLSSNDVIFTTDIKVNLTHVSTFKGIPKEKLIFAHFSAIRAIELIKPDGVKKIDPNKHQNIDDRRGKDFIQHLVNLKVDQMFAQNDKNEKEFNELTNWFDNLSGAFRKIFGEGLQELIFDRNTYDYNLKFNDGQVVAFSELSDGYSAVIDIVSELIMRMVFIGSKAYDAQGIVLIDEIETHLHIDLQKKILPFLTNFFPKIQFIVTTHSPFVLNSIENAVIFDLEKKLLVEDMTGYSVNAIVESYFDSDDYSTVVKEKMSRYENLSGRNNLSEEDEDELFELKEYFEDLPKMFSPELALKINQIQLANLSVK